jgi:transcription initiation factor IIE alpha subunit
MINPEQSIPCPVCQTKIPFDTRQLLMGVQFACPNCNASIGLASESHQLVQETMEKFEDMKNKVARPGK